MTACCAGITPDRVNALAVVGGSHYPFSEPYGELRRCDTCGAHFLYTYDHDNEIGYQASPPTLDAMTPTQVAEYVPRAVAVAKRMLEHCEAEGPAHQAAAYRAEIQRLLALFGTLRVPAGS